MTGQRIANLPRPNARGPSQTPKRGWGLRLVVPVGPPDGRRALSATRQAESLILELPGTPHLDRRASRMRPLRVRIAHDRHRRMPPRFGCAGAARYRGAVVERDSVTGKVEPVGSFRREMTEQRLANLLDRAQEVHRKPRRGVGTAPGSPRGAARRTPHTARRSASRVPDLGVARHSSPFGSASRMRPLETEDSVRTTSARASSVRVPGRGSIPRIAPSRRPSRPTGGDRDASRSPNAWIRTPAVADARIEPDHRLPPVSMTTGARTTAAMVLPDPASPCSRSRMVRALRTRG